DRAVILVHDAHGLLAADDPAEDAALVHHGGLLCVFARIGPEAGGARRCRMRAGSSPPRHCTTVTRAPARAAGRWGRGRPHPKFPRPHPGGVAVGAGPPRPPPGPGGGAEGPPAVQGWEAGRTQQGRTQQGRTQRRQTRRPLRPCHTRRSGPPLRDRPLAPQIVHHESRIRRGAMSTAPDDLALEPKPEATIAPALPLALLE